MGHRRSGVVSLMVVVLVVAPAFAEDDLVEDFLRLQKAVLDSISRGNDIKPEVTAELLAQVEGLNQEALLQGKLENMSFYPSLYLALLGCEAIGPSTDKLEIQDEILPAAVDQTEHFAEVYLRADSVLMRDSDKIIMTLSRLDACLANAVGGMQVWVYDPEVSQRFRQFRHGELAAAPFWDGLGRLKAQGVLKEVPVELGPFMTATPTPSPTPTPTQAPTPIPLPTATPAPIPTAVPIATPIPMATYVPAAIPQQTTVAPPGRFPGSPAKNPEGMLVGSTMVLRTSGPSLICTIYGGAGLSVIDKSTKIKVEVKTQTGDPVFGPDTVKLGESLPDGFEISVRLRGQFEKTRTGSGAQLEVRLWINGTEAGATYDVTVP